MLASYLGPRHLLRREASSVRGLPTSFAGLQSGE